MISKISISERYMAQPNALEQLSKALECQLLSHYGPLLGSRELWRVLGYSSPASFRQAKFRNQLPVKIFEIEGRRGSFALTIEVAAWLATQRLPTII